MPGGTRTLGEELLEPTAIYVGAAQALLARCEVGGIAHITGGGLLENIPRVLPEGLGVRIDTSTWKQAPLFDLLQERGNINSHDMMHTFNCGVGMCVVVGEAQLPRALELLKAGGDAAPPMLERRRSSRLQGGTAEPERLTYDEWSDDERPRRSRGSGGRRARKNRLVELSEEQRAALDDFDMDDFEASASASFTKPRPRRDGVITSSYTHRWLEPDGEHPVSLSVAASVDRRTLVPGRNCLGG